MAVQFASFRGSNLRLKLPLFLSIPYVAGQSAFSELAFVRGRVPHSHEVAWASLWGKASAHEAMRPVVECGCAAQQRAIIASTVINKQSIGAASTYVGTVPKGWRGKFLGCPWPYVDLNETPN